MADFSLKSLDSGLCLLHQVYGQPFSAEQFHWDVFVKLYQVEPCLIMNWTSMSSLIIKFLVLILCFKGIVTLFGNCTDWLLKYSFKSFQSMFSVSYRKNFVIFKLVWLREFFILYICKCPFRYFYRGIPIIIVHKHEKCTISMIFVSI